MPIQNLLQRSTRMTKSGRYNPSTPFGAAGRCEHDGTNGCTRASLQLPAEFAE